MYASNRTIIGIRPYPTGRYICVIRVCRRRVDETLSRRRRLKGTRVLASRECRCYARPTTIDVRCLPPSSDSSAVSNRRTHVKYRRRTHAPHNVIVLRRFLMNNHELRRTPFVCRHWRTGFIVFQNIRRVLVRNIHHHERFRFFYYYFNGLVTKCPWAALSCRVVRL